jgi:hypothetical protein
LSEGRWTERGSGSEDVDDQDRSRFRRAWRGGVCADLEVGQRSAKKDEMRRQPFRRNVWRLQSAVEWGLAEAVAARTSKSLSVTPEKERSSVVRRPEQLERRCESVVEGKERSERCRVPERMEGRKASS